MIIEGIVDSGKLLQEKFAIFPVARKYGSILSLSYSDIYYCEVSDKKWIVVAGMDTNNTIIN